MPELSASGEIFSLDGQAGFDEGLIRGDVGGDARLSFDGHFELCHGLRAALSAEAIAEAEARLAALFLLAGYAQGEALAAAGVQVDCSVQFDLFDSVGLSAEAAVFAEAAVAGRLSAGLTFEDVARAARPLLSNLAYDLLIYLLNEIDAVAGMWGKAAFAAMAKVRLDVKGSLADDRNAGFVIEAGAEAGLSAGGGYDFYAALRLRNPKRFYLNAVERITQELVTQARRLLSAEFNPAIEALELVLPIALHAAYELGQALPLNTLLPPAEAIAPFIGNCVAQLQRYSLQKLISGGIAQLDGYIRASLRDKIQQLSAPQRASARQTVEALIANLQSPSPPEILDTLSRLADLLSSLAPGQAAAWRQPLTIVWLGAAGLAVLRDAVGSAQASASTTVVGLGTIPIASGVFLPLPAPPHVVRDELDAWFNPAPSQLEFKHAVAYLLGSSAADLYSFIPGLSEMLDPLLASLGITARELIEAALSGAVGQNLQATDLYHHFRAFASGAIENAIKTQLLPALRAQAPGDADFRLWLDEAAAPCLDLINGFVFDRLDALAGGSVSASDVSPFQQSFRSALSSVVSQIVTRNVLVVLEILEDHVFDGMHQSFLDLAANLRVSRNHPAVVAALNLVRAMLPPVVAPPPNFADLVAGLAADIFAAAAEGVGPEVYTAARRLALRQLQSRLLLSLDGSVDYAAASNVDAFFRSAASCLYIPDPDAALALVKLELDILGDQATRTLPLFAAAIGRFFLGMTAPVMDQLDPAVRGFLNGFVQAVDDAAALIQTLTQQISQLAAEIQAAAQQLQQDLANASSLLSSPGNRSAILDAIESEGASAARLLARQAPGYDLLPAQQKTDAQNVSEAAFHLAFQVVRPVIDEALKILSTVAGQIASLIGQATSFADALNRIGSQVRQAVENEVIRQLGIFGALLPPELSPAGIAASASAFLSGLAPLRSAAQGAIQAKQQAATATQNKQTAETNRQAAQARHQTAQNNLDAVTGGPLSVNIFSPADLAAAPKTNWAYRHEAAVRVDIAGANLGFLDPPPKLRISLSVNGHAFTPPHSAWASVAQGIRLNSVLSADLLLPGLNSFECSVTNGRGSILRKVSLFAFQPGATLPRALEVSPQSSRLTPETHANDRVLVLTNSGRPLSLKGWSVLDRNRDRFDFPDMKLLAGASVTLVAGSGALGAHDLLAYLAKSIALNADATVYVLDPNGILRFAYSFGVDA